MSHVVVSRALTFREKILLALASTSCLSTTAIQRLVGISSSQSARWWLNHLKKLGYVEPIGTYKRVDGAIETLWAITQKGLAYLAALKLVQPPFDAAKSARGSGRGDGGGSRVVGGVDVSGARLYVQRLGGGKLGSWVLCGGDRCYLDDAGDRSRVLDGVGVVGGDRVSVEFGVEVRVEKRFARRWRGFWAQVYLDEKRCVLRAEVRGYLRRVRDLSGFEYVAWGDLFERFALARELWDALAEAVASLASGLGLGSGPPLPS